MTLNPIRLAFCSLLALAAISAQTPAATQAAFTPAVLGQQAESEEDAKIGRAFDPSTINVFEGTVVDIGHSMVNDTVGVTMRLLVDIQGEQVQVQLGPEWVIQGQGVSLDKGDEISILGSKVVIAGASWIIAAKVRKGESQLDLRSELGVPVWLDKSWAPKTSVNSASGNSAMKTSPK